MEVKITFLYLDKVIQVQSKEEEQMDEIYK